jgi:tetratricopeptide (TPR) repeat protein
MDDSALKLVSLEAQTSVEKALDLDPNLADAHYARALVLWSPANRFPHAQVIHSYKRALALNPNLDEAHHRLGVVYFHIGLFDKAWTEVEKALELDPSNTLARFRLGVIRLYQTRYEEALTLLQGIPRDANPALAGRTTATALFQLGRLDEAEALVDDLLKKLPNDEGGNMTSVKAMLLAKAGRAQESEAAIQRAITIGKGFGHFHHTTYNIASAYALLNRPAEAVTFLQAAAEDGFPCYPWFEKDANLDTLRKDDRFIALMARLRKQWKEYLATL